MLRQDDMQQALVVLECWRQGLDHGLQATLMVMGCLSNRQKAGWGSWLEVLKGTSKFSATLEQPNRDKFPDIWEPQFVKLLHAVSGIWDSSIPDPALGGLYWADLSKGKNSITNPWFREKVMESPLRSVCANQNAFTVFK